MYFRDKIPHLRKIWIQAVAVSIVIGGYFSGWLSFTENQLIDLRFGLLRRQAGHDLVIVAIDPSSLRELRAWPWPRSYHAQVIDRLLAAGAEGIAFDVDFSSSSAPDADHAFEAALGRAAGRVALAVFGQPVATADGYALVYSEPLPAFERHVQLVSANVFPDSDGLVRSADTREPWGEKTLPFLAAFLAGATNAPFGRFGVDFAVDPQSLTRLSYVDVLKGRFDPEIVRGKNVVIGATAIELGDQIPVPVYRSVSGVVFHGLAYQSLVQNRALHKTGLIPFLALVTLITLTLGPGFCRWSWPRGLGIVLAVAFALMAASIAVQAWFPILLEVVPAIVLTQLLYGAGLISRIDRQAVHILMQSLRLHRTDALMRNIVENSFDAIVLIAPDGRLSMSNPAAQRLFAHSSEALQGMHVGNLIPNLVPANARAEDVIASGGGEREFRGYRRDGSAFSAEVATNAIKVNDESLFVAIVRDVTERKRFEAELRHQALHDALTDLPNRTLLADRLEQSLSIALRDGKPLSLMIIDLDRFKDINDTLGHQVGDLLLCQVAKRLRKPLRRSDTVARLGGDEFAILLPAVTDVKRSIEVAERITKAFETPFEVADLSLEVGVSVGIAVYPDHAQDTLRLVQCADVAMYMAKKYQTGMAVYDSEKDRNSVRSLALTGELRQAIENDQIGLAYQPKIDLRAQRICSMEALARWQHPVHGFIPPDEFILQAEMTGLIVPLTRRVLEMAFRQLRRLLDEEYDVSMSINLAARTLLEDDLPDLVAGLQRSWRIEPRRVILEITESSLMADPDAALANLDRLHQTGTLLSIDDFGTGYSSLAYLKRLPVDELKVDKSFVLGMDENESDQKIVRSTIGLAHNLGLKVVAEGVETEAHLNLLKDLGCDLGQGYFFARPLAPEQLATWLKETPWGQRGKMVAADKRFSA